nr:uncharacterized protein LOC129042131 [Pongo pygmaeus]
MGLPHVSSRSGAAAARSPQRRAVSLSPSTQRGRLEDGGRGARGSWHLRLSPFPRGCVSVVRGKRLSRLSVLTLIQTLLSDPPSCSQGPISEPWLTLGGNCPPAGPSPPSSAGRSRRRPQISHRAVSPAAAEERSAGVRGATSELALGTLQLPKRSARSPRTPCPRAAGGLARRGEEGCAPSSRSHLRVPPPASGTPGPRAPLLLRKMQNGKVHLGTCSLPQAERLPVSPERQRISGESRRDGKRGLCC